VKLSPDFFNALSIWYASSEMAMFLVPIGFLCVYVCAQIYEFFESSIDNRQLSLNATIWWGRRHPPSNDGGALVKETKELLDELLETLDVMADKKLLRDIAISRSQASKGQIRSFRRLMVELGLEPQVRGRSNSKVRKSFSKA
jgi:hypothetical protein